MVRSGCDPGIFALFAYWPGEVSRVYGLVELVESAAEIGFVWSPEMWLGGRERGCWS